MELYNIFKNNKYPGWEEELSIGNNDTLIKNTLRIIEKKLIKEYEDINKAELNPSKENLFNFLKTINLNEIKIVIWQKEPKENNIGKGIAINEKSPLSKELVSIYKNINRVYPQFNTSMSNLKNKNYKNLEFLNKQGVLLLNEVLMVDKNKRICNLWSRFLNVIISIINKKIPNCVHVFLYENPKIINLITSKNKLFSPPVSSYSFLLSNIFIELNIVLDKLKIKQINWNIDEKDEETYVVSDKERKEKKLIIHDKY